MTTDVDYALLAANAYAVKAAVTSDENTIPIPDGWSIIDSRIDDATGFTARAYKNNVTGEISIAYTGTTFESLSNDFGDWFLGNVTAGSGLTLAPQVIDAAKFYLDVVQANPSATNITFTGHSLGGGLASLMAVYFDRKAVVFDEAPFEKSADSSIVVNGLKLALAAAGYTLPDSFAGYIALDPLTGVLIPSPTRVAREGNVSAIYVKDEILSLAQTTAGRIAALTLGLITNPAILLLAANVANISGSERSIDANAISGSGWGYSLLNGDPVDLHSIPLLTAFLQSPEFLAACQNSREVLQEIFTSRRNVSPADTRRNFLNLMVQRQTLNENPLGAFAGDVERIKGDLATAAMKAALIDLEINLQYAQGIDHVNGIATGVFESTFKILTGGIRIEHRPEDDQWVSGSFAQLDRELGKAHPELSHFLPVGSDRYSLATEGGLVATELADDKRDLMIGGSGNDSISSGGGNDLLFGGAGTDTLTGGTGDDLLIGGTGFDTYLIEGHDTIIDADGAGQIKDTTGQLITGLIEQRLDGTCVFIGDPTIAVTRSADLTLTLADGTSIQIQNFQSGQLGLTVANAATAIATTGTILGDQGTDPADHLNGTAGNDLILAGEADDVITAAAGDDQIEGGTGQDRIDAGDGNDRVIAGEGADIASGGEGNDRLYADAEISLEAAIAAGDNALGSGQQGDWLNGGLGDDILVGGAGNDALLGGGGGDYLYGGDGDDRVEGDDGNDNVSGDAGNDEVFGGAGALQFAADVRPEDVLITRQGNDLALTIAGADDFAANDCRMVVIRRAA